MHVGPQGPSLLPVSLVAFLTPELAALGDSWRIIDESQLVSRTIGTSLRNPRGFLQFNPAQNPNNHQCLLTDLARPVRETDPSCPGRFCPDCSLPLTPHGTITR